MDADLVICANTIAEVSHSRVDLPRLRWALPRLKIEPVTDQAAKAATELLKAASLHGHKYAIDATVVEAALRQPGPVAMLTSDTDDMRTLCGGRVRTTMRSPASATSSMTSGNRPENTTWTSSLTSLTQGTTTLTTLRHHRM
jgi:hypothetical protein